MALVTKSFSDIITFTRASTGTFFNSAGVLTSANSNIPRFDFNPATLAAQGLLIEEQRTNACLRSQEFDVPANWGLEQATVTANAAIAPDGTQTADALAATAVAASHNVVQYPTVTSNSTVCFSIYVKKNNWSFVRISTGDNFGAGAVAARFNLDTGAILATTTSGATPPTSPFSGIQLTNNGWYRIWVGGTLAGSSTSGMVRVGTVDSNGAGYVGDGTSGIFIWGAQLEAGAFPTSYIPTTTTTLTRSADVASVNTLAPWYNATEGTLYAEIQAAAGFNVAGLFGRYAAIQDALNNNSVEMFFDGPVAGAPRYRVRSGGVNQAVGSSATGYTANTTLKASLAYKVNDFAGVSRGVVDLTDTSGVVPVGPTVLSLGSEGGTTNYLNGWLRRVTYYPRRMGNAELVALTAPISSTTSVQPYSLDTNFIGNTVSIGS